MRDDYLFNRVKSTNFSMPDPPSGEDDEEDEETTPAGS